MGIEKQVWKYDVCANFEPTRVIIPVGYKVVGFRAPVSKDFPSTIWIEVQPEFGRREVEFQVFGTGYPIPDNAEHVATYFHEPFVWHLYNVGEQPYA
jgi:hypothetical protein